MSQSADNRIYFSGLNGLRFFAAIIVIITHIELLKMFEGMPNIWENPIIFYGASAPLYFFFVLSGFLITYLLLVEKEKFKIISIKQFYMRRILRIWPLYYFVVLLGFFLLPQLEIFHVKYQSSALEKNFFQNLILYILILPQLAFSLYPAVPNIGQAWSIGVEELFYLFWPLIIGKSKNIIRTIFKVIIYIVLIKMAVLVLGQFYGSSSWYKSLKLFVAMSKFECMAIGGIGSYLIFTKHPYLIYFQNKVIFYVSLILIVLLIYTPKQIQDGIHIVYSVLFLVVILYYLAAKSSLWDHNIFAFLGKITYGIYMYHFMIISVVFFIYKEYIRSSSTIVENAFIYTFSISLTILVSALSYQYFEKWFINLKSKYSPIKSGEEN